MRVPNKIIQLISVALFVLLGFLVTPNTYAQQTFSVVLDAGHGGKDPGAIGKKIKEKDINLDIVLKLGQMIKQNHPDVKVIYTRTKDVFVELGERARIANSNNADLFISVHTNAAKSKSAQGTETYALGLAKSEENLEVSKRENSVILLEDDYTTKYAGFDPTSAESYIMFDFMQSIHLEQSINLASFIQNEFKNKANRIDRGVRQGLFWVLRATSMPSVLIEVGYISNVAEENFLSQPQSRKQMAESIYNAFSHYKADWSRKQQGYMTTSNNNVNKTSPIVNEVTKEIEDLQVKDNNNIKPEKSDSKEEYRIQIFVSENIYKQNSSLFKGLTQIRYYKENGLYKYTYGSFKTRQEALKELPKVSKLFKGAFVVHFIGDKKQ